MVAPDEVRAGLSVALSGRFAAQGRQARNGLRLWAEEVRQRGGLALEGAGRSLPLRLVVLDDGSEVARARTNVRTLLAEEQVHLLLGPYSSGLTLAVAAQAEAARKVLWNHGGSSDAIYRQGWRYVVGISAPASTYFRPLPGYLRRGHPGVSRIVLLRAARGTFAAEVAAGLCEAARPEGFDPVQVVPFASADREERLGEALARGPEALVLVGSFEDEVALIRRRRKFPPGVRLIAAVAAGVGAFGEMVGEAAEGVVGSSQWEPSGGGSPGGAQEALRFAADYRAAFGEEPDYPAAQAYAAGVVAGACVARAGSLEDDALRAAAAELDLVTSFGRFRIDPGTGRQVGHRPLLVQWRQGRKLILAGRDHEEKGRW